MISFGFRTCVNFCIITKIFHTDMEESLGYNVPGLLENMEGTSTDWGLFLVGSFGEKKTFPELSSSWS